MSVAEEVPLTVVMTLLKAAVGVVVALVWMAVNYAIAKLRGKTFSAEEFGRTVLVGLVLSLFAILVGTDPLTVEGYTILQLLTILIDKFEKKK